MQRKHLGCCGGVLAACVASWALSSDKPAEGGPDGRGGLLFFAPPHSRSDEPAASNPHILGALLTVYWSEIEPQEGSYNWQELDRRINLWVKAGKKLAVRIMWGG